MTDVGVNAVREVHGGRTARQRPDLALRREDVDLFGIQVDLQVSEKLLRIPHLLLKLQKLAHPLEMALIVVIADAAFLVFPVRRNALFGASVHLLGPDLDLEREAMLTDDCGVQ